MPEDRATKDAYMKNNTGWSGIGAGAYSELSTDYRTKIGNMFYNLRHQLGEDVSKEDRRVWVVKIQQ
jgi:hypothetical protein